MILDLNNPESIVAWWGIAPDRHGPHLLATARRWPQFAWPIRTALRRIKSDAELNRIFQQGLAVSRARAEQRDADSGLQPMVAPEAQALAA